MYFLKLRTIRSRGLIEQPSEIQEEKLNGA
jgi:hypothetical protein